MSVISLGEQVESLKALREFGLRQFQDFDWSEADNWGQLEVKPDGLSAEFRNLQPGQSFWINWRGNQGMIFFPRENQIGSVVLEDGAWQLIPVSDEDLRTQLRAELAH